MSSLDQHADNAIRLLDIVYDLHGSDKGYPYQNIPFMQDGNGEVSLSANLMSELQKSENENLLGWAQENIQDLF